MTGGPQMYPLGAMIRKLVLEPEPKTWTTFYGVKSSRSLLPVRGLRKSSETFPVTPLRRKGLSKD